MRMEKPEQLLRLALMMQSSAEGISLRDIQNECNVGRRTAERMRDALISLFPQTEEIRQEDKIKRWRLPSGSLNRMIHISAEELAEMKTAIEILKKDNLLSSAEHLETLWLKIKSHIKQDDICRIETDLEALLEAEGYAMRPGPRPKINSEVLSVLRQAVKGCLKVRFTYHGRIKNDVTTRTVCPYGFIYGIRHYLIAWCEERRDIRTFSLSDIQQITLLNTCFAKEPAFDLRNYSKRSFGVYQEEPFDVIWRFSAKVADEVKEHFFHHTQRIEEQSDGGVLVYFTAGGVREMCWYIMTWNGEAEIIEPAHLKEAYYEMLDNLQQSRAKASKPKKRSNAYA